MARKKKKPEQPAVEPQKQEAIAQEFNRAAKEVTPYPTPSERDLEHVGIKDNKQTAGGRIRRTDDQIAQDRLLATKANPLFAPLLKMPFSIWAKANGEKRLELTSDEALTLALPVTQLIEYYFPNMPHILIVWGNLTLQVISIFEIRLKLIQEVRDQKNAELRKQGNPGIGKKGLGQEFPSETPIQRV